MFGISRDDAASFLTAYTAKGILPADPFVSIDREGVGELIKIGVERGRQRAQGSEGRHLRRARRRSGLGRLLRGSGLDYVSCSPFRVPIARLAAAQAALGKTATSTA